MGAVSAFLTPSTGVFDQTRNGEKPPSRRQRINPGVKRIAGGGGSKHRAQSQRAAVLKHGTRVEWLEGEEQGVQALNSLALWQRLHAFVTPG